MHEPVDKSISDPRTSRRTLYVGVVLLILIAVSIVLWYWRGHRTVPAVATAVEPAAPLLVFDANKDALGVAMGPADAKVVVREFADFQCPGCAGFEPNLEQMRSEYVDTGRIRFVFFDFPLTGLHKNAMAAAQVARCAGRQGQYWPMHDMLYKRQQEWGEQTDPTAQFQSLAGDLKLDAAKLMTCLKQGDTQAQVQKSMDYGDSLGVHATPSYAINGVGRAGGMHYGDLKDIIEQQLAHPTPAAAAATVH